MTVEENVWQKLLAEARASNGQEGRAKLMGSTVLMVGDHGAGKRTLVGKMQEVELSEALRRQGVDPMQKQEDIQEILESKKISMAGVGYSYLEPTLEDDSFSKISVWLLDSLKQKKNLLKTIFPNQSSLANGGIIVVVDLSKPWKAIDTLNACTKVVEEYVMDEMGGNNEALLESLATYMKNAKSYVDLGKRIGRLGSSENVLSTPENPGGKTDEEDNIQTMPESVLTKNLGVPIIVVGTKADVLTKAAEDNIEMELKLEYLQRHLRTFCLSHGATLVYTSSKTGTNVDLLYHYLIHRLCSSGTVMTPIPCAVTNNNSNAESTDPSEVLTFTSVIKSKVDSAYVPAGLDHKDLVESLANTKNQKLISWSFDTPFSEVFPTPKSAGSEEPVDASQVELTEGQGEDALAQEEFLAKLLAKQKLLPDAVRASTMDAAAAALKTFNATASSFKASEPIGTPQKPARDTGAAATPASSSSSANSSPEGVGTSAGAGAGTPNRRVTAQDAKENPALIANFFQNLLNKTGDTKVLDNDEEGGRAT